MRHGSVTTAITILTLSLGIGVMAALFAVVDAVLLRPLVPDQDRVVYVTKSDVHRDNFPVPLSLHEFAAWREAARSFESLAAVDHAATGPTSIGLGGTTAIADLHPCPQGSSTSRLAAPRSTAGGSRTLTNGQAPTSSPW